MKTLNIIADIAGRYDELQLLLKKMPEADKIILVGDLIDRGRQSLEVIQWAMKTPNVITLMGNHEHMMIDTILNKGEYGPGIWEMNGGDKTLNSYHNNEDGVLPKDHMEWMENLPRFYKRKGLFISHAPWDNHLKLGEGADTTDILWNRQAPKKREGVFQIYGHNGSMQQWGDYAICIDDCSRKQLTGIHWPSKMIYQQEYI